MGINNASSRRAEAFVLVESRRRDAVSLENPRFVYRTEKHSPSAHYSPDALREREHF